MISLHPDEAIVLRKRRYWLPIAVEGVLSFLVAILPIAALLFAHLLPENVGRIVSEYNAVLFFFATGWFFAVWILFFVAWTNYYLDVVLVTTRRLIDIEQIGLFARDLAELRLENIQDMRVEIVGIVASLLHFGNLHIQTAGASKEFVIRNIHDPHSVKEIISERCDDITKPDSLR